jgi:outer membrane murein-binding lipoprotein Lpp
MFRLVIPGVMTLLLAGCTNGGELDEIKRNQKEILKKLDQLSVGSAAQPAPGAARPAAAAPRARPGQPDPSQVYAYPVGDSPTKGPANAWVTVVESSAFT